MFYRHVMGLFVAGKWEKFGTVQEGNLLECEIEGLVHAMRGCMQGLRQIAKLIRCAVVPLMVLVCEIEFFNERL